MRRDITLFTTFPPLAWPRSGSGVCSQPPLGSTPTWHIFSFQWRSPVRPPIHLW